MTTTRVRDLPDGGSAAVNDYFVGEHTVGTTVRLKYAPTLNMDPTPGLANNLTLNGFSIGPVTATQIGYLSNITSDVQTQINSKYSTSNLATGMATFLNSPTSANLAATMTDETGTGANVFANTPTLVTPILGTPTSGTLTNCTGLPIATGVANLGTGVATFLTTPTSANLASALTDETGSGANVFATSPTLVTPLLGTPTSGTLTNCTGLPVSSGISGLGTGVATFLATPTSANLASALTDETGTGANVFGTSPTIATPNLTGRTSATGPASGDIGQILQSTFTTGQSLTSAAITNVNSISLIAGNYLVFGIASAIPAGTTTVSNMYAAINTANNAIPQPTAWAISAAVGLLFPASAGSPVYAYTPPLYVSINSTTTYYLNVVVTFAVSTLTCNSGIFYVRIS